MVNSLSLSINVYQYKQIVKLIFFLGNAKLINECYTLRVMLIIIHVKTRKRADSLKKLSDGTYSAELRALPAKGEANDALRQLLSREFGIPITRIVIARGRASRLKHVLIS